MFLSLTMSTCQTYLLTFITLKITPLFPYDRLWFGEGGPIHGKNCCWPCCKESRLAMASQPADGWHPFLWSIFDQWRVAPDCRSLLWQVSPHTVPKRSPISPLFFTFTSYNFYPFFISNLRPPHPPMVLMIVWQAQEKQELLKNSRKI